MFAASIRSDRRGDQVAKILRGRGWWEAKRQVKGQRSKVRARLEGEVKV
jgi:hypothetical protein